MASCLKVIAEGEVAQHFKIGAVAVGVAHVLDVAGADALLAGGHPLAGGASTSPVKYFFMGAMPELMSSRLLSSLGNQRKAGQAQVLLALKILQKFLS